MNEWHLHYSRYTALSEKRLAQEADGVFTRGDVPGACCRFSAAMNVMRGYYQGAYRDKMC